ncbi:MAG TPA: S1/P1 nuclease [Cyclobacteriaceae bacterium]|nr:S1/P1 nuclease [Cyclobacteriaceae bacterium]
MAKILLTVLVVGISYSAAYPWGATGHRVIGEVAGQYLTGKAKKKLATLLQGESLAIAGTWMDEVRSNRKYDYMADWHWVTIPEGTRYADTEKNPNGDIIEAIDRMVKKLKSGGLTRTDEAESLKVLIHLIGDIHQPLHVGTGDDRGGNDTKVKWMGRSSNLHRVWDSDIIDETKLSYTEMAAALDRPPKTEVNKLQSSGVLDWARESMALRKRVYDIGDGQLGYDYTYQHLQTVERRLMEAGIRLAGILNSIYGK